MQTNSENNKMVYEYLEYMASITDLKRASTFLRFNLKAEVTRPVSGVQMSGSSLIALGISNFCRRHLMECFLIVILDKI